MNRKLVALLGGLLAFTIATDVQVALAQRGATVRIAVVDAQFLMQNAEAAKSARATIEKARADLEQRARTQEDAFDKLSESIAQQRATLAAEVYEQLLRGFRQKIANHEIDMQERRDRLEGALREATRKVADAIVQVVDEIAKEQNFAAVLSRSAVINTAPDITQEVLTRLNRRTPSVTIDLSR